MKYPDSDFFVLGKENQSLPTLPELLILGISSGQRPKMKSLHSPERCDGETNTLHRATFLKSKISYLVLENCRVFEKRIWGQKVFISHMFLLVE